MADYPKPKGWQGGSDDFKCVWTHYGHRVTTSDLVDNKDHDQGLIDAGEGRHADYPEWYGGC